ncbi:hypothetical protein [Candidatus Accumulibacter vicinus]|nr:hypothetical protein [Candidatus Accumulibacter vicinus]
MTSKVRIPDNGRRQGPWTALPKDVSKELSMRAKRSVDRRQTNSGPLAGMAERRYGIDRRKFQLTGESIAALEARLAALACQCDENGEDEGSGWDKVIIPLS